MITVADIPVKILEDIANYKDTEETVDDLLYIIRNKAWTPHKDGEILTNGEMIKAIFPNERIYRGQFEYWLSTECTFDLKWWNAPYKADKEGD